MITGEFLVKVKGFFKKNYGAPFVIGFQFLLLSAAGLLIAGNSVLANEVAVYAYFMLIIGFVLQLFSFARSRGERSKQE